MNLLRILELNPSAEELTFVRTDAVRIMRADGTVVTSPSPFTEAEVENLIGLLGVSS